MGGKALHTNAGTAERERPRSSNNPGQPGWRCVLHHRAGGVARQADVLTEATKVGSAEAGGPAGHPDARSHPRPISRRAPRVPLCVMGATDSVLCGDLGLPQRVMNV